MAWIDQTNRRANPSRPKRASFGEIDARYTPFDRPIVCDRDLNLKLRPGH